jgi:SAM-dependent methyltransferase
LDPVGSPRCIFAVASDDRLALHRDARQDEALQIALDVPVTADNFDEARYLAANPDVAAAVKRGALPSGRVHYDHYGRHENRMLRLDASVIADTRRQKMKRISPLIDLDMPHVQRGQKFDFLTPELRAAMGIADTDNVSAWEYDIHSAKLINELENGLILDCGAGRRPTYYSNIVNYEIVDYDTTDVIGVGERLPFKSDSFDGVLSLAVLDHVRDPFACAAELIRVLKPGGTLLCAVPFLQPQHGYPHHYYNMAPQGLRALFERQAEIQDQIVFSHPAYALRWIGQSWADGLSGATKEAFLVMPMGKLLEQMSDDDFRAQPWVSELPREKNFELACSTAVFVRKPEAR